MPSCGSYNTLLSKAFRKYGINNFTFEILEECESSLLDEKETYYINLYNSLQPNGYNMTPGGDNRNIGNKLTYEQVKQIDKLLLETDLTNQQIGSQFSVSENMICGINTGYY